MGRTNIGSVVTLMERSGKQWEQIILITDEGENGTPTFSVALERYMQKTGFTPNVVIVRCKSTSGTYCDKVEKGLRAKDVEVDIFDLTKSEKIDYYSIPNLLPMLAGGSRVELLMSIMEMRLPNRQEWEKKNRAA